MPNELDSDPTAAASDTTVLFGCDTRDPSPPSIIFQFIVAAAAKHNTFFDCASGPLYYCMRHCGDADDATTHARRRQWDWYWEGEGEGEENPAFGWIEQQLEIPRRDLLFDQTSERASELQAPPPRYNMPIK